MKFFLILGLVFVIFASCGGGPWKEEEVDKEFDSSKSPEQQKRIRDYHRQGALLKTKYKSIAKSKDTLGKVKYAPELKSSIKVLHKEYFRKNYSL